MRDNEFTKILGWPGYRVYRHEIDEAGKMLCLWVRRKRGNRKLICSGCGRKFSEAHDYNEREVRDLPWGEYRYEGAMLRYLQSWIDQLRWQRLVPFQKLAYMLLDHLDGILNYCRTKVRFGVVEAINANIKTLLRRGRGYKNLDYLLLKAQRMAATKTEFIVLKKAA